MKHILFVPSLKNIVCFYWRIFWYDVCLHINVIENLKKNRKPFRKKGSINYHKNGKCHKELRILLIYFFISHTQNKKAFPTPECFEQNDRITTWNVWANMKEIPCEETFSEQKSNLTPTPSIRAVNQVGADLNFRSNIPYSPIIFLSKFSEP